jgi:hypothetical protein
MALQPFVGPWLLFQFLNLYTVGRTPWTGDQPVARPLPTQNKRTHISMPRVMLLLVHYEILCCPNRLAAGSNTSTVTLRVVGGDEMASLKSETVKYGREYQ